MHTTVKLAAGLSLVALLAGCDTLNALKPKSWNPFADKPKHPPAELLQFKPAMAVTKAWSVSVGSSGGYTFSPAYAKDAVYVAAADGSLMKLDAATGKQQWRVNTGTRLSAGVGTDGELVAVAGEDGAVLAYDSNGKLLWKAQVTSEVLSSPAVGEGAVVVRSIDNRVTALDGVNGSRRWFLQRQAPALTMRSSPGVVIFEKTAYVAMPGGKLLALAMNNGAPRWEGVVGDPKGATELERLVDVSGMPMISNGDVCAVAYHGRVTCFIMASGQVRWSQELSSDVGIGMDERFVFAADENGAVNAYARPAGQSAWRSDKLAYRRLSAPVSFGRAVAVGDYQGHIHFLSREDGSMLARVDTDGSMIRGTPIVAGKVVLFQTQAGQLVALSAE
jgi:outer membrane protein assembly factor BamB